MDGHIVCPNCKQSVPLSDALSHEIRDKYRQLIIEDRKKQEALYQKKLDEEKQRIEKDLLEKAQKKAEEALSLKLTDSKNESEELKKQNQELKEQLLELTKTMRQLKSDSEQAKLELEKKLAEEQDKIRGEEQKRFEEEYKLKILERDKKLQDVMKANEDLKRKLEQGSQQMQGEVLELELENILKNEFPFDEITPVAKGMRGGDIIQIVKTRHGKPCGSIIWESKRTKAWSNEWAIKLRDDQRAIKAEAAVIVSEVLPTELKNFGFRDGIWIANTSCMLGLAHALRKNLLEVAQLKMSQEGKTEKMEILYNYIYGTEFKQRIEAIMEAFTSLQESMEKEKRWFAQKWAKDEMNIRRVLDSTMGLSGDLQGISGKDISATDTELLEDGKDDQQTLL